MPPTSNFKFKVGGPPGPPDPLSRSHFGFPWTSHPILSSHFFGPPGPPGPILRSHFGGSSDALNQFQVHILWGPRDHRSNFKFTFFGSLRPQIQFPVHIWGALCRPHQMSSSHFLCLRDLEIQFQRPISSSHSFGPGSPQIEFQVRIFWSPGPPDPISSSHLGGAFATHIQIQFPVHVWGGCPHPISSSHILCLRDLEIQFQTFTSLGVLGRPQLIPGSHFVGSPRLPDPISRPISSSHFGGSLDAHIQIQIHIFLRPRDTQIQFQVHMFWIPGPP